MHASPIYIYLCWLNLYLLAIFEATWNTMTATQPETVVDDNTIVYETAAEKEERLAAEDADSYSPEERSFYDAAVIKEQKEQLEQERKEVKLMVKASCETHY